MSDPASLPAVSPGAAEPTDDEINAAIRKLTGCRDIVGYGGFSLADEIRTLLRSRVSAAEAERDYWKSARETDLERTRSSWEREREEWESRLAAAEAEIARLKEDAARLDWLEANYAGDLLIDLVDVDEIEARIGWRDGLRPCYATGKTVRSAIDAARSSLRESAP